MPILPLDHPEPFAATLGVMLYPGTDKADRLKARAFPTLWIPEPLRLVHEAGHRLTYEALYGILMHGGELLVDLAERYRGGTAIGDLFKTLFILAKNDPALASWENAIKIYKAGGKRAGYKTCRTELWSEIKRF